MKVYLSKPRYHWYSPYTWLEHIFFWKPWSDAFRGDTMFKDTEEYPEWVEKWADRLTPISKAIEWTLNKIHPQVNYVKIDYWDTWSMDYTLSPIILPMLKQLKATKHGYGLIDDEDVPWELRSYSVPKDWENYEMDPRAEARYEYVLDEMIWTFEQLSDQENESKFYSHEESNKESTIYGKLSKIKIDHDGLNAHNERISNGLKLFGKYYRTLWD
jgi:hypothetical protein